MVQTDDYDRKVVIHNVVFLSLQALRDRTKEHNSPWKTDPTSPRVQASEVP
jgi:hypothetical protein